MTTQQPTVRREALDPVCGMTIDPADAAGQTDYQGQTYYFCHESCLERFREDPAQFLEGGSAEAAPPADPGAEYICPMGGMALEPAVPRAATVTRWTCPMHPEVVRDEPGSCPICGMALEPMTVAAADEENPELRDMTRRFWVSMALTLPVV